LKLQEAPELIPTGEMPRSFTLSCDRYLTDKVTPGNRVKIVGVLSILNSNSGMGGSANSMKTPIKQSYIRVIGIQSEVNKDGLNTTGFALPNIT
jgi:DNA replication licensing factor MCM5